MFSHSVTAYLLYRLITGLKKGFENSLIVNTLYGILDWFGKKTEDSKFLAWSRRDVFTAKYYETSFVYSVFNAVLQFILSLLRKIQLFVRKLADSSVTLRIFDAVMKSKYLTINRVLAAFIALMFILPHELWNNLYAFMAMVFFAFWVFMRAASGKLKISAKGLNISIFGFLAAVCISTITALVFSDAIRIGLFMITSVMLTYSVYATVDTKEKLMEFITIILAGVSFTAVIGIAQRIMGVEVDLEFVDVVTNAGMPGRVFSTFSNPNNFAELLLLFMPFFVPLFFHVTDKKWKMGILGAFIITLAALAMTYSRSCWVGFALATVLFVLLYDKRLIVPLIVLVFVAIPFVPETIMNRIFTIGSMQDTSNSYRLYIWESCMRMIRDFGATGLGLGPASFKAVYPTYADPAAITAPHSHMLYMELILEMGIIGFVTFFAYMYSVIKKTTASIRKMDNTLKCVAFAGMSALLGIAFVCCAEYVWFYPRVMFAFWIVPGILLATARIAKK